MKVVLLAPTPPPNGGIASWTKRMLQASLADGWEVTVVDEKPLGKRLTFGKGGSRNFRDELKRSFRIWKDLRAALSDPEAKVVHSCIPSVTPAMIREYVCACITKRAGRKFIIHFRCTVPVTVRGRMGVWMLKKLCRKSDMIFSLNQRSTEYLTGMTATPVRTIPNFITAEELAESHEIRDEIKTVLYVGGIVATKGIGECLEMAKAFPDIAFRFVGQGDDNFPEVAEELKLTNVIFTGPQDRPGVMDEMRRADVFVFLSYFRGEGFSNALCEAMAAGLPCIVSDWAANADMIGKEGGFVVPVKDAGAAIAALSSMKAQSDRASMSSHNRNKVADQYVESKVLTQYVEAYKELTDVSQIDA